MDLSNIIHVSLLSKFMNNSNNHYDYLLIIVVICYYFYRSLPYAIIDAIETYINNIFLQDNTSYILIPYHNKTFSSFGSKNIVKTFYSNRFHALNYYIKKNFKEKLHSLTEIVNFQDMSLYNEPGEYVLLPKEKQKILIDEKNGIYFEILLDVVNEDKDDKKEKNCQSISESRKHVYKIWKQGRNNINVLNDFLDKIEKEYQKETN